MLRPLPDSITKEARAYYYRELQSNGMRGLYFSAVLLIVQGEQGLLDSDVYAVDELEEESSEGPFRYFALVKCDTSASPEGEGIYCVRVPRSSAARWSYGPSVCNCLGFNRWRNCKHADALTDILNVWS